MRHTSVAKAFLLVLALAIVAAGCGESDDDAPTTTGGSGRSQGMVIGLSIPQAADPLLQLARDAFIKQSEAYGNEVIVVDANADPNKQLADVQTLIQRDVDAIAVHPVAPQALQTAFDAAREAGIPIVTRQTTTGGPYFTNIQGDERAAAAGLADVLADEIGSGAKIGVIAGPPPADAFRVPDDAFVAQARRRGLDVVDVQHNERVQPDASAAFTRTWKERYGDELKGVYDTLATLALADQTVFGSGFEPLLVTRGALDRDVDAVRDGRFFALMYDDQVLVGKAQAWAANIAARGLQRLPPDLHYAIQVVQRADADSVTPNAEELAEEVEFEVETVDGVPTLSEVPR